MKKSIFYLIVCCMALMSSCTKDDGAEKALSPSPIVFTMPVIDKPQSRAVGEITTAYPKSEEFIVNAVHTKGDFVEWNDASSQPYMTDVVVKYDKKINSWGATPAYYWPKNGKLTFVAYSPACLANHVQTPATDKVTYGVKGLRIENFVVPAKGFQKATDPSNPNLKPHSSTKLEQFDLLYTDRACNKVAGNMSSGNVAPNYNGLDMRFRHALASVKFNICVKPTVQASVKLVNIRMKGVQNVATFDENLVTTEPYAANPVWTPTMNGATAYTTNYDAFDTTVPIEITKSTTPQSITALAGGTGRDFILLPQDFTGSKATINFELTMTTPLGEEMPQHLSYQLEKITPQKKWQIGHRYTYNFIIDTGHIYFNPQVEEWTPEAGGDIVIKIL